MSAWYGAEHLQCHFEGRLWFMRSAEAAAGCVLVYYHSNGLCFNYLQRAQSEVTQRRKFGCCTTQQVVLRF